MFFIRIQLSNYDAVQPTCCAAQIDVVILLLPEDRSKLQLSIKLADCRLSGTSNDVTCNTNKWKLSENILESSPRNVKGYKDMKCLILYQNKYTEPRSTVSDFQSGGS